MKARYYGVLMGVLVAGIVFSSYLAYSYSYFLDNILTPEEQSIQGFRHYICDLQRQLERAECHVDGITVGFDDIDPWVTKITDAGQGD